MDIVTAIILNGYTIEAMPPLVILFWQWHGSYLKVPPEIESAEPQKYVHIQNMLLRRTDLESKYRILSSNVLF